MHLAVRIGALGLVGLALAACPSETDDSTQVCTPHFQEACYDGPEGTQFVGACRVGVRTCLEHGDGYTECQGQVEPVAEDCGTPVDDDCDGEINEDCACAPGFFEPCFSGSADSNGVGVCHSGLHECDEDGAGFGPCQNEVIPGVEDCTTDQDEDCDGVVNEPEACLCRAGDTMPCYSGPAGTEGVGICTPGVAHCLDTGGGFGPCEGEVLPEAEENCSTPYDDDCNGSVNEANCSCNPGDSGLCYSGPASTLGVGVCTSGTQMCLGSGTGFGNCSGDVAPQPEDCSTPDDDDCDGVVNETDAGCECTPDETDSCYSGPPFTLNVGLCKSGTRTCLSTGHWGTCTGEVVPLTEDCNTNFDEDCDGSVNQPTAGCDCYEEDPTSLASEDCVFDAGESLWHKPIPGLPTELGADAAGNAYVIIRRDQEAQGYEPVPDGIPPAVLVGRYFANGDLFWGKEVTGVLDPTMGYDHIYDLSVAPDGVIAFTAPAGGGLPVAFGDYEVSVGPEVFRMLYSIDPYGYPIFAIGAPRFSPQETNSTGVAIAATGDGSVFYVNETAGAHLVEFDSFGEIAWDKPLGIDLDDAALAPTPTGGVVLAFTTTATVDLGLGPLGPIVANQPDVVIGRFNASGTPVWTKRPAQASAVFAANMEPGVIGIVDEAKLIRVDSEDGTLLSVDPLPAADIPTASFSAVGASAVFYTRYLSPEQDFGLGLQFPYGGQSTGNFMALRGVGGTRWARSPKTGRLVVAGAGPNVLLAAFEGSGTIDLDGLLIAVPQTTAFLTRLSY